MVKGVSRQVIVVHSPDPKLFDQAIFILKDEAVEKGGVTDEMLLKAADKLMQNPERRKKQKLFQYGAAWAFGGALVTGFIWLMTVLL